MNTYILDKDGVPKLEPDFLIWGKWWGDHRQECRVGWTVMVPFLHYVSTVFLGLDHSFTAAGPPLLWETFVYGSDTLVEYTTRPWGGGEIVRWASLAEAREAHRRIVKRAWVAPVVVVWEKVRTPVERLLSKLYDWAESRYYNTLYGIRNCVQYFPVVWRDRDWDYSSMMVLWEFKFKRMLDCFGACEYHAIHAGKKHRRRLTAAKECCRRLAGDDYNKVNPYYTEWYRVYTGHPGPTGDERSAAVKRLYDHEEYLHKQDREYLMKLVTKYIYHWSD